MNCDVIGFIALDEILGFFFGGVVRIALVRHIGNNFLHDSAANSTCFRIPFDVITTFEHFAIFPALPNRRCVPPSNGQEESAI